MISAIIEACKVGLDICFFKKNAADMPYRSNNQFIFIFFIITYLLISLVLQIKLTEALPVMLQNFQGDIPPFTVTELPSPASLFFLELVQLAIVAGIFYSILKGSNLAARFPQAFLAILVTNTILSVFITAVIGPHFYFTQALSPVSFITLLILAVLSIINITTGTRIIRDALETNTGKAFLILIGLSIGSKILTSVLVAGFL
jgi:hypothetical protein